MFVVLIGFTLAGILINSSFRNWSQSPVSTTIETLPISKIKFPKIAICPPKNTFTNLNYDLEVTKNMTLDDSFLEELKTLANEILQESTYDEVLKNISCVYEENKYFNWYYGLSKVYFYEYSRIDDQLKCKTENNGEGSVTSEYFGEKFDLEKFVMNMKTQTSVAIYIPDNVVGNRNVR